MGFSSGAPQEEKSPLLEAIDALLKNLGSFYGTATELLQELSARAELNIHEPNALTRALNPYTNALK